MNFEPTMHKLSNGVTVILDPMDVATAEVSVCFKTGGLDEQPNEYGLTHFCEHMFCKGTARFPGQRIAMDYIADNGGSSNAQTSLFRLEFVGRIISRNLPILIDFIADEIKNPLFDADMIENERGVVIEELRRSLSRDSTKMRLFVDKNLYDLYVSEGGVVLGNAGTINSFTRNQMLDFVSRRLSAHNCLVCVSGKIENSAQLLQQLEQSFAFLPTHDVAVKLDLNYTPHVLHNFMPERKTVVLEILFPDLWDDTPENMYKNICVGKFKKCLRHRLFDVLRSDSGLTYDVSPVGYGTRFSGVSGTRIETSAENVARAVALIAKTANKVYSGGQPTDDDLARYRNQNELADANFLENNADRCSRLVGDWLFWDKVYDFNQHKQMSDTATSADVVKYSRGCFDGAISIITHGPKFDGDLKQIWYDNFK